MTMTSSIFIGIAKPLIKGLYAQFGDGDKTKFKGQMIRLMDLVLDDGARKLIGFSQLRPEFGITDSRTTSPGR